MRTARQHPGGFSVVELLVVIAIVAMLIAITLPAIGKAKSTARRAACESNLRQTYLAFNYYGMDNGGYVPLGYRTASKQFNSMVYSGTAQKFVLFGTLYQAGFMKDPGVFYCPAESNPQSIFNSSTNPWPPGATATVNGYAGYGTRPMVQIADDPTTWTPAMFTKLTDVGQQAIFSDLTAIADRVDSRHQNGINVLYGDASVQWIPRAHFDASLSQCTAIVTTNAYNTYLDAIWTALDAR